MLMLVVSIVVIAVIVVVVVAAFVEVLSRLRTFAIDGGGGCF